MQSALAIIVLLVVCQATAFANAETVSGAVHVVDGDTLDIGEVRIRLVGIDAAESGQRCVAPGRKIVRPGDDAESRVEQLASGGLICSGTERDQYGRFLAVCRTTTGVEVNRTLVKEGLAWAFVKYSNAYVAEEAQAKAAKLGIWALACQTPWDFRAERWSVTSQKAPSGCPIKGNISKGGKIYHMPWDRYYTKTKIDTAKGERWFCDENQAQAAGQGCRLAKGEGRRNEHTTSY
jgi:endonuclease YncB( thermonuclease family)